MRTRPGSVVMISLEAWMFQPSSDSLFPAVRVFVLEPMTAPVQWLESNKYLLNPMPRAVFEEKVLENIGRGLPAEEELSH